MTEKHTLDPDYFKKIYAANDDPWNFKTSEYEAAKYAATINALPNNNYSNALEIGCSIGVLTELLAKKCGKLLSVDVSEKALEQARERCKNLENVSFRQLNFVEEVPAAQFDLIVISEVAYYLSVSDWKTAMKNLYEILLPKGNVILVHWLPEVHDYPQTGDEVHESFETEMHDKMKKVFSAREENYRIDVWEKTGLE